jgi:hypothetical protein
MLVASRDVVSLGEPRRRRLEAIVVKQTAPQRLVLRAKIVLAAWRTAVPTTGGARSHPRTHTLQVFEVLTHQRVPGRSSLPDTPARHIP